MRHQSTKLIYSMDHYHISKYIDNCDKNKIDINNINIKEY